MGRPATMGPHSACVPAAVALACFVVAAVQAEAAGSYPDDIRYNRDVQPILAENCFECHGPDEATRAAGLRLDNDSALQDLGDYYAIRPGEPDQSELMVRITSTDPDLMMPPPEAHGELAEEEIELLRRWIEQGAEYEPHWAFVTPDRPELPAVENDAWVRNPIDHFVLARLEAEDLQPSDEASRQTLARRLSLDLTGLPPDPQMVRDFVADDRPDAYERLVENLLASPHYGERWAMHWLDIARYGDTDGYDYDHVRETWLYRDWVIHAFNQNMTYDQFVLEQVAGDMLEDASDWQKVATGFIRNSPVSMYRFDQIVDRVSTTGTAFLGLSMSCAQCHDHKYDPVSMREFYKLFAVFNNDDDTAVTAQSPLNGIESETLAVTARAEPRETRIAQGGSFLSPGDVVAPGTLTTLHDLPKGGVSDRLELARWLIDTENPLLSRVTVNRYWEAMFGRGIVSTSEDLGIRATQPTHPQLLDWLAVEFAESGWSVKDLHRLIVTSATYRQDAAASSELVARDPQNRLLARGPRFRVQAETIRDISLKVAGLLDDRVGGPSVHPPQPYGITENRFRGAYTWNTSDGADRYRRGMYTFWKRAALHPSLEIFDAPRRETTCVRRSRSNNPLQALVTLNDPAFVEAAVMLGRRMLHAADADGEDDRIASGFERVVSRSIKHAEAETLRTFFDEERQRFRDDPDAAAALLASAPAAGEHLDQAETDQQIDWAAYAMIANVLLSLDETLNKP